MSVTSQSQSPALSLSTAARQFFHTDAADIVGLLCLHKAKEGGESDVVSAHNLWNTLQKERPDVAELLVKPNWYFDRKGEVSDGQNGWVQKSVSTPEVARDVKPLSAGLLLSRWESAVSLRPVLCQVDRSTCRGGPDSGSLAGATGCYRSAGTDCSTIGAAHGAESRGHTICRGQ